MIFVEEKGAVWHLFLTYGMRHKTLVDHKRRLYQLTPSLVLKGFVFFLLLFFFLQFLSEF